MELENVTVVDLLALGKLVQSTSAWTKCIIVLHGEFTHLLIIYLILFIGKANGNSNNTKKTTKKSKNVLTQGITWEITIQRAVIVKCVGM